MTELPEKERRNWLRLARTQNVGPVTFATLIARFGTATRALEEIPKLARRGGAANLKVPTVSDADREIESLAKLGGQFVASCEAIFPSGLGSLDPPPPILAILGRAEILSREYVAIVGARNASALGRKFAATLAADLARSGFAIASGMARGIDTAAHEASLFFGTCAVLAGGVDIVYPPENSSLYERLCRDGVAVSEMPMGESPQSRHFPRRNRIISGIARGVVVVEAAEGSGSLITANYALEQGREVFAVPGSPLDPRAKGTNRLIRDGATLTESADDVLTVLRPMLGHSFREPDNARNLEQPAGDESEIEHLRVRVLELLSPSPIEIDELVRQTGAPPGLLATTLLELELAGRAKRHPGSRVSLC
jgi:DNA processing protein